MATNAQALKLYLKLSVLGFGAYYGYLHKRCSDLKKEYTDFDSVQAKKDTTRPNNVYYGLNWGYRSDETMEKALDSGNLIFYNYDCDKCFSPTDTLICKAQQTLRRTTPEDSENMAFTFRTTEHKLLVVTDPFQKGQVSILPYHEFVNKPYVKMIKVR